MIMSEEISEANGSFGASIETREQAIQYTQSDQSSSPSNLPLLLKIQHPSPDAPMTTLDSGSDSEEASTMEVNVDVEDISESQSNVASSNSTFPSRPSVINLGSSFITNSSTPNLVTTPTNHASTPTVQPSGSPRHGHHNGERPERMREWLIRMINSGRFLGLEWLDKDSCIFRVPWVHAKKRDYNQERDAALFKEWAIHSGKYGDGSDVTTWKINFRCALNGLKDIIERKELEGPDCRVYQMLPTASSGRRRKRRHPIIHYSDMMQLQTPPAKSPRSVRPKFELPLGLGQPISLTTPTDTPTTPITVPTTPIHLVPIVTCAANFPFSIPVATIQASPTTTQHFPLTPSPTLISKYRPISLRAGSTTTTQQIEMSSTDLSETTNHIMLPRQQTLGSTSGGSDRSLTPSDRVHEAISRTPFSPGSVVASPTISPKPLFQQDKVVIPVHPPLRTGNVHWPSSQFSDNLNALTIRIMYGSITVYMETHDCYHGCRIFYGPLHCRDVLPPEEEVKLFGPLDAHQVSISPRHPSPLASEVFRTLKRGLILEVENGQIYATALCRAVVYTGSSPLKNTKSLEKEEKVKVFDYSSQFIPELKHSIESRTASIPKPYVIFCFGQHWGSERPLNKNLITVVATHCKSLNDMKVNNIPIYDELLFESLENQDIRIISPTRRDLDAEEFLNPPSTPSTPHCQ